MGNSFMGKVPDSEETGTRPLSCANCGELLPMTGGSVLTCSVCGQGHRALPSPEGGANAQFQVGDRVAVLWGEHWWSAHVTEIVAEHERKVHYEGWAPSFDAVVDTKRIRAIHYEPRSSIIPPQIDESKLKIKRSNMLSAAGIVLVLAASVAALFFWAKGDQVYKSGSSATETANMGGIFDRTPGTALGANAAVERGASYYVKWGDGWYRGKVIEIISEDEFVVQYDGWGIDSNEIVSRNRLRTLE